MEVTISQGYNFRLMNSYLKRNYFFQIDSINFLLKNWMPIRMKVDLINQIVFALHRLLLVNMEVKSHITTIQV